MAQDPELIRAMARHLAATLDAESDNVEIRCDAFATLNGRPAQRLIDPEINLGGALPSHWIVPLQGSRDGSKAKERPLRAALVRID